MQNFKIDYYNIMASHERRGPAIGRRQIQSVVIHEYCGISFRLNGDKSNWLIICLSNVKNKSHYSFASHRYRYFYPIWRPYPLSTMLQNHIHAKSTVQWGSIKQFPISWKPNKNISLFTSRLTLNI